MKVQCGQCPAKYAVADDRVRDKKVRIHCKRCNAAIVVDGRTDPPLVTTTPARPSVGPRTSSVPAAAAHSSGEADLDSRPPSPRPVAHTMMGGLEAPAERLRQLSREMAGGDAEASPVAAPEAPLNGAASSDAGASDPDRWRVALTKHDLRWMTTREIIEAYHAGAVKLETFVFRAGMANWVTLLEVPEIARALTEGKDSEAPQEGPGWDLAGLSPSSLPPPRKAALAPAVDDPEPPQPGAAADGVAEPEPTLPFDLTARTPGGYVGGAAARAGTDATAEGASSDAPDGPEEDAEEPLRVSTLIDADEARAALNAEAPAAAAAPAPPAAVAAAPKPSKSNVWVWIGVLVFLALLAVFLLGPRFGLKLG